MQRIADSPIELVMVTDTIPLSAAARACTKVRVVSVSPVFGEAIRAIHQDDSVSRLFD